MYKFQGFTEKANTALNLAIEESENLGHTYIGSEHLLVGLLTEGTGVAASALSAKGVKAEDVENLLKATVGVGTPTSLTPDDFTPRCKRIVELSISQARSMGHNYVGTEHILLALIKEADSYAVKFLNELGARPQEIFSEILNSLGGGKNAEPVGGGNFSGQKAQAKGKSGTPTLDQFGKDLTQLAKDNGIDPVIGREKEIQRVIQILSRRTKNNPCLIGEPGVGKTAIAEGLALQIAKDEVPELLKEKRVLSLDLTSMVAGTKYRGDFEERIKSAIAEVKKAGDVILFIDEVHTLIGAGAAEGAVDAANILKPSLARGELQVIGATTLEEYRKNIEKDAALERRFQPIIVGEPTPEEAVEILRGLRDKYEAHHKVKITDASILAAVKLSSRYIADRYLPDKAIDLVDEAASRVRLQTFTPPPYLKELEEQLKELQEEKSAAIHAQDFERAAKLRDQEQALKTKMEQERAKWKEESAHGVSEVSEEDIAEIVSSWTGVPVIQLTEEESRRLLRMEEVLHRRIVGQDAAVTSISKAIRRGRVGLKNPGRPMGSFLFLGPTGVGKTELCRALSEAMFGDEDAIIKLDMSEYMEKHTVSRLVGSPPGYVGYDEGGQLTEKVRRKPYSVVLFDEVEKAHPDVFNMLLQILEDGVLTDAQGRRVSFKNCIIIMTSNVGAKLITEKQNRLGFSTDDTREDAVRQERIHDLVMGELKDTFRPEFLNRLDEIIVFRQLTQEDIKEISKRMLRQLSARVAELGITLSFTDAVIEAISKAGFDQMYGARPLRRAIQSSIEDPLSEEMLENKVVEGGVYECDYIEGAYRFTVPPAEKE